MDLKGIEVLIEDTRSKQLVAIYPYRDEQNSMVTLGTRQVLPMMCGFRGSRKKN